MNDNNDVYADDEYDADGIYSGANALNRQKNNYNWFPDMIYIWNFYFYWSIKMFHFFLFFSVWWLWDEVRLTKNSDK